MKNFQISSVFDIQQLGGNVLSESTEQDIMSRLTRLEQKMNDLDRSSDALIDELESLHTVARELKKTGFVDSKERI